MTEKYVEWIMRKVIRNPLYDPYRYEKLIYELYDIPFAPGCAMDANRDADGRQLRIRYAREKHMDVMKSLPDLQSSMLEMMVGFAIRTYEEVMKGLPVEYSPDVIFWMMIENMGLDDMTDEDFDRARVQKAVDIAVNGPYDWDGTGGALFRIRPSESLRDFRMADIWYQMQWWAADVYEDWKYGLELKIPLKGAERLA